MSLYNKKPILCFNKWMEIVVNDIPRVQQVAEFDAFIQIRKDAIDLKYKLEFLRRCAENVYAMTAICIPETVICTIHNSSTVICMPETEICMFLRLRFVFLRLKSVR
jgi:hypothetical protein